MDWEAKFVWRHCVLLGKQINAPQKQVTQMYRGPLFLRGFDDDVRKFLLEEMRKKKIDLKMEGSDFASQQKLSTRGFVFGKLTRSRL